MIDFTFFVTLQINLNLLYSRSQQVEHVAETLINGFAFIFFLSRNQTRFSGLGLQSNLKRFQLNFDETK